MPEQPEFFLPNTTPDTWEARYSELAEACQASVPSIDERIFSIKYEHDGIEWTATVGEPLSGTSRELVRRKGQRVEKLISHDDPATVVAIFGGNPFRLVTDGFRTRFANPFLAGIPRYIRRFAPPKTLTAGSVSPH